MPGFRRQVRADRSIPALRLARRRRRATGKLARHRNEQATALYGEIGSTPPATFSSPAPTTV